MTASSRTIKQATIGIALLVLVSKGLGFLRGIVVAYYFGTNSAYDVYLVAVTIPIAIFTLITGLSNLLVPAFGDALAAPDKESKFRELWHNLNALFYMIIALVVTVILLSGHIISLIAPGFTALQIKEAAGICRIASVIIALGFFETLFRSGLNCEKRFFIPAAGPIIANVLFILLVWFFARSLSTYAMLYGLVFGYLAQILIVFFAFRRSTTASYLTFGLPRRLTNSFFTIAVLILIVEASSQLYAVIDRYFASFLETGVISALGYTYILFLLPVSVFAYALSTAIFPYLTDAFVRNDKKTVGNLLTRGINVSLLLSLPISMLFWIFSKEMVTLIFQRGAFGAQSAALTSELLQYFVLGIAGQSLIWLMSRAFYASRKFGVLIVNVIIAIGIKMVGASILLRLFGHIGLALSSSISYSASGLFLAVMAWKTIAPIDWKIVLRYFVKLLIMTGIGYIFGDYLRDAWIVGKDDLFLRVPIVLMFVTGLMGISGYILNIADIREIVAIVFRRKSK